MLTREAGAPRLVPFVRPDEPVMVGLPDTVWFPEDALRALPDDRLSFLLFPVEHPQFFDAVVADDSGRVQEIQVKQAGARSNWIWGAFKLPARVFRDLELLWRARNCQDEYIGTLVNTYLGCGGAALAVRAGRAYVDVGTLHGYRAALGLLAGASSDAGRSRTAAMEMFGAPASRSPSALSSRDEKAGTS